MPKALEQCVCQFATVHMCMCTTRCGTNAYVCAEIIWFVVSNRACHRLNAHVGNV